MATKHFSAEYEAQPQKQINLIGTKYNLCKTHFKNSSGANNDTYVLAQGLDGNAIIKGILLHTSGVSGANDNDIIICKHDEDTIIKVDSGNTNILSDGFSMSDSASGVDVLGENINNFDFSKSLKELTGIDEESFDILLKTNSAVGSNTTMSFTLEIADNI